MVFIERLSLFTALVGILDAGYLTVLKYTNNQALCFVGGGECWSVNLSQYSQILGIPTALFGLAAYLVATLAILFNKRNLLLEKSYPFLMFGITLVGVLFSIYLTYLEIAVIKALCPFCVVSAIAMLVLFILSIIRLAQSPGESK